MMKCILTYSRSKGTLRWPCQTRYPGLVEWWVCSQGSLSSAPSRSSTGSGSKWSCTKRIMQRWVCYNLNNCILNICPEGGACTRSIGSRFEWQSQQFRGNNYDVCSTFSLMSFTFQNELKTQFNELKTKYEELSNIKMRLKGGNVDTNASAAFFDAIFVDPEANVSWLFNSIQFYKILKKVFWMKIQALIL